MLKYELIPVYDVRKSFYGKAHVEIISKGKRLYSYNTLVCEIIDGKPKVFGRWSGTTTRHIKEFLRQERHKAKDIKQIMKDYSEEETQ